MARVHQPAQGPAFGAKGCIALPAELRAFLGSITEETGVPVEWLSFGPMRDETLWLGRGSTVHDRASAWTE